MSEQYALGEFIQALESVEDKSIDIRFDFCGMVPTTFDSWRGIYAQIALGYKDWSYGDDEVTVWTLLEKANAAVGSEFTGWKGGEFVMDSGTLLWVDNPGEYHHTVITGIQVLKYTAIIQTQHQPDEWG